MIKEIIKLLNSVIQKIPVKKHTEDIKLGKLFLEQLPSNGKFCNFFRHHDIKLPFHESVLDEILHFNSTWNNTEHEFIKSKLERIRKKLISKTIEFDEILIQYVRRDSGNLSYYTTKLVHADMATDEVLLKEAKVMRELNKAGTEIFKCHQKLTKQIRKLLNR